MLIRDFQSGDEEALWSVFFAAVRERTAGEYTLRQREAWAPSTHDRERWAERVQGMRPLVAEEAGRIAGYAALLPDGYVDHFYVAPWAAGRGVAKLLMRHILATATERGLTELYSEVSLTARGFFEKCGFTVEAPQEVTVRGVTMHNFLMRKRLDEPRA